MKLFKSLLLGLVLIGSVSNAQAAKEGATKACSLTYKLGPIAASKAVLSSLISGTKYTGNFAIKHPIATLFIGSITATILPKTINKITRNIRSRWRKTKRTSLEVIKCASFFSAGSLVTILYLIKKGKITPGQLFKLA